MTNAITPVLSSLLSPMEENGIKHAFFTRQGGVSQGIYQSLNVGLGSDDKAENVIENRRRVANYLAVKPTHLITAYQVHSAEAAIITQPFTNKRPEIDGLVTATPGLAISVLTADCGPILLADKNARVIGAAHAGWRGAFSGIIESTIKKMEQIGANRHDIKAAIGPSIGPKHYEVGPEFIATFIQQNVTFKTFFKPSPNKEHVLFDLWSFTLMKLEQSGVEAEILGLCTYQDEERFFSYRRKTHRSEPDYGRQISAIVIEEK